MRRFPDAEFGFENCDRHERTPGSPAPLEKAAPGLMSSDVSTLDDWGISNLHASDVTKANLGKVTKLTPKPRPRVDIDASTRLGHRLGYLLLSLVLVAYAGWAWQAGWL
jgi:hypothetical protein